MTHHKTILTVGALVVAALLVAASSRAGSTVSKINHLSINRSAELAGVLLPAGVYTFEVLNGHTDIVQVRTRDNRKVMYTGFTIPVERPAGMPQERVLSFGESRAGEPVPITAWFPLGSSTGHQFR